MSVSMPIGDPQPNGWPITTTTSGSGYSVTIPYDGGYCDPIPVTFPNPYVPQPQVQTWTYGTCPHCDTSALVNKLLLDRIEQLEKRLSELENNR